LVDTILRLGSAIGEHAKVVYLLMILLTFLGPILLFIPSSDITQAAECEKKLIEQPGKLLLNCLVI